MKCCRVLAAQPQPLAVARQQQQQHFHVTELFKMVWHWNSPAMYWRQNRQALHLGCQFSWHADSAGTEKPAHAALCAMGFLRLQLVASKAGARERLLVLVTSFRRCGARAALC